MLKNYFKIAFRNIMRNKLFASINTLGLAVGMACFILITLWIQDELSFDKFHANKDDLYLLTIIHPDDVRDPNVPYALAPRLADEFPEIIITPGYTNSVISGHVHSNISRMKACPPSFTRIM